jgi:chromosome segregation ATPase
MAQVNQAAQLVQQHGQLVQAAAQELEDEKAVAEKAKADARVQAADLQTKQAQFQATVAESLANITMQEAKLQTLQNSTAAQGERDALAAQVKTAVSQITDLSQQFNQSALQTLAEIMSKQQTHVIVPPAPVHPKIVSIKAKRVNGELQATPVYESQMPTTPDMGQTPGMGAAPIDMQDMMPQGPPQQ